MIGVTNNSPQQINAALIALKGEIKNEVKNEIIEETKIEQIESDVIDDNIISQEKTWSSDKISSMLGTTYPEGYVYMQMYFPAKEIGGITYSAGWGKTPIELGMLPAIGYKWEEFTTAFEDNPYMKIMSSATQSEAVKSHHHDMNHHHSHRHTHMTGSEKIVDATNGTSGAPSLYNLSSSNYKASVSWRAISANTSSEADTTTSPSKGTNPFYGARFTSTAYSGGGTGTTAMSNTGDTGGTHNEVLASGVKIWRVVADT